MHAEQTTLNWISRTEYQDQKNRKKIFGATKSVQRQPVDSRGTPNTKTGFDAYQNNLLSKISSMSNPSLNRSLTDDFKAPINATNLNSNENSNQENISDATPIPAPKTVYHNAIDAFKLIGNRKGFLTTNSVNLAGMSVSSDGNIHSIIGVYCIRWRRSGEQKENETKLMVNCLETVDAPLNLYCYFDEKMYVKVPMTLTVSLKNSTNATIHLRSCLKNADNFMFAGHTQVCLDKFNEKLSSKN